MIAPRHPSVVKTTPSGSQADGVVAWPAIAALTPFTLQDFPGTPAAMLFTQGCNLRCA